MVARNVFKTNKIVFNKILVFVIKINFKNNKPQIRPVLKTIPQKRRKMRTGCKTIFKIGMTFYF